MGEPIERDGALFTPDDFRYYNGELPTDVEPDRIFMAVDPAFGGGDFVASPVCYQYGEDIYVHDVVYDNRDPCGISARLNSRYRVSREGAAPSCQTLDTAILD